MTQILWSLRILEKCLPRGELRRASEYPLGAHPLFCFAGGMSRDVFREAKERALQTLSTEWVLDAFRAHLGRHKVPVERVTFDYDDAVRRIREAVLLPHAESRAREDEISGETDGDQIWIVRGLSLDDCVETLLHEAMHDSVFVTRATRSGARKGLSCELEHAVIYGLL